MERRILITGASGFIGTNLLMKMQKEGLLGAKGKSEGLSVLAVDMVEPAVEVAWEKADLRTTDWGFLEDFEPTHVLHLAALTNHRLCADLGMAMKTNVDATQALFSKLASLGCVEKIVFPSSIVVYAETAKMPLCEDSTALDYHHNHYSLSKGLCEELCQHFRAKPYNLPILTFRLSNVYGPYQEWRPDRFPNLLPQIMRQAIIEKKIEVWNKTPVRDFIYVEDACDAFMKGLDTPYNGVVNIASGVGTSVGTICSEISKLTGAPVVDLGKQVSGPTHVVCDTARAQTYLGWKAATPMAEGLRKTVEYYKKAIR